MTHRDPRNAGHTVPIFPIPRALLPAVATRLDPTDCDCPWQLTTHPTWPTRAALLQITHHDDTCIDLRKDHGEITVHAVIPLHGLPHDDLRDLAALC